MRGRIWIFAVLVAAALGLHLVVLSAKAAQFGEDNVRARLAASTSALRAQLELLDARLAPRAVGTVPDLVEATRPPSDPTQPASRPDDKALRAAASALQPEPDLIAVVNGQGAIVTRRSKPVQTFDDASGIPLAKAALEGNPAPAFATWDGTTYRFGTARVPGNVAAVVVGSAVDDRLAGLLKSQVDADVTLVQNGKILASSLPQGEARAALMRWAAAPSSGYGVLQIHLPGIGNPLSGKLPRGATRYAVRGALVTIDSGVSAALTVPAAPYLAWLGRYQAFYLIGLVLFVLFSLVWGLLAPRAQPARVAAPEPREEPVPAPRVRPAPRPPSLVGTDVGEPRPPPAPRSDVPWPASDGSEVKTPPPGPRMIESLDPEVPPEAPAGAPDSDEVLEPGPPGPASEHPMWSADPFAPSPSLPEPEVVSAEEIGLVEAKADGPIRLPSPPPPPADMTGESEPLKFAQPPPRPPEPAKEEPAAASGSGDFSFAGLLDEAHNAPPPEEEPRPSLAQDYPDTTAPGAPSDELIAESRRDGPDELMDPPFPGDEPTRIEPVSAALLDKMRARDDEEPAPAEAAPPAEPPAQAGWGSLVGDDEIAKTSPSPPLSLDPEMPAAPESAPEPAPEANVTMQDFSMPAVSEQDPDEPHWRETYDKFRELKAQLGEAADKISFEKFSTKLRKNRADLLAKHNCKGVRFSVYEKDGKAAIKASAIR